MIADLHCHFPMHLVADEPDPEGPKETWLRKLLDKAEGEILDDAARILNDSGWSSGWRVSLEGLHAGGAEIVCSVLYWPASEFDLADLNDAPPRDDDFERLKTQLEFIEDELPETTDDGTPVSVARTAADLEKQGIKFVHCVEGGFQLGRDRRALDERVQWLSEHGVLYITVAHLFYRELATEAPAIPLFTDQQFLEDFKEPKGVGLTELGIALIEAMYRHKILIDISHMSERAVLQTFALVEHLDEQRKADPTAYPIIASHVGMQSAGPQARAQEYNLSEETALKIAARKGAIGLIGAQHQLGDTPDEAASARLVKSHLDAIGAAVGEASTVAALGTDIDGFIKPTLSGFEKAEDLAKLQQWIVAAGPSDPEAILHRNAERVICAAFSGR
ncbi:MAG TPA: membrane dipeptidase [Solirubrobacteraceae bacterium]|nr:membrane dipeptidase [Solirubrobacteraceae bacterium]